VLVHGFFKRLGNLPLLTITLLFYPDAKIANHGKSERRI
jgi:hypothetical protein